MIDLISIIIPVYNSSSFLKECLVSVANQSYTNFEVIIIDDRSQDNSYEICTDFCKHNRKFKVIHNATNCGVSHSRNVGISYAKGKYICFIDSDDFIENNYLQKLYDAIEHNDIAFTRFDKIMPNGLQIPYFETKLVDLIRSPSSLELFFVGDNYVNDEKRIISDKVFGSCCRSMFKLVTIKDNNIKFKENVKLAEDTIFMMNYLLHCKNCGFADDYLYHYRDNSNSAVKRLASNYVIDFYNSRLPTLMEEIKLLDGINNNYYSEILVNYIKMDFNLSFVINEIKINSIKNIHELKKINKADYRRLLSFNIGKISRISKIKFKRKFLLLLIKYRQYKILSILLRSSK